MSRNGANFSMPDGLTSWTGLQTVGTPTDHEFVMVFSCDRIFDHG
jgi:hypothetical protein